MTKLLQIGNATRIKVLKGHLGIILGGEKLCMKLPTCDIEGPISICNFHLYCYQNVALIRSKITPLSKAFCAKWMRNHGPIILCHRKKKYGPLLIPLCCTGKNNFSVRHILPLCGMFASIQYVHVK
jgi:hypothetical protein